MIDSQLLAQIVDKCIKTKNTNKLRYIGQSLDCLLFQREFQYLWDVFNIVNDYLHDINICILGPLEDADYPDLDNINIPRCVTFNTSIAINNGHI